MLPHQVPIAHIEANGNVCAQSNGMHMHTQMWVEGYQSALFENGFCWHCCQVPRLGVINGFLKELLALGCDHILRKLADGCNARNITSQCI